MGTLGVREGGHFPLYSKVWALQVLEKEGFFPLYSKVCALQVPEKEGIFPL